MSSLTRLLVISNRLPVTMRHEEGRWAVLPSSGGLVTALRPLLNDADATWVGWTGTEPSAEVGAVLAQAGRQGGMRLAPVYLSAEERARFYCGFANEILWPLFHDLQSRCHFDPGYWETYVTINERFADAAAGVTGAAELIWVHDYHLMSVAAALRVRRVNVPLGYFHHIPFPSPDIFEKLPWRQQVLRGLLAFDVVGFQTQRDRRNFLSCVRQFAKPLEIENTGDYVLVGRRCLVGTFPIGIDFREFVVGATAPEVEERARQIEREYSGCRIVLGVDRLDYTKGLPERLLAFEDMLQRYPDVHRKVVLLQVVVPSREDIPKYAELKSEVQRRVSEVNGRFGDPGWMPVHYIHRPVERGELLALYRSAAAALVTPLKDGMNLVAKEYCAARVREDGVLLLSEFAGAADQLRTGAILVNPYDVHGVGDALHAALALSAAEQRRRMRRMRRRVEHEDIYQWQRKFFAACSFFDATVRVAPARAVAGAGDAA
jgi:trehalose 6-phosphate synthase